MMSRPVSSSQPRPLGVGGPAGYGQSCTNCSRAKCKCILRAEGGACERCHRLNKDCQQMVTTRKRTVRRTATSRTAQLEEKLDDLVSILKGSHQPGAYDSMMFVTDGSNNPKSANATAALDSLAAVATNHRQVNGYPASDPESQPASRSSSVQVVEPSLEEAQTQLNKFRSWLPNFPFMYLGPEETPYSMQEERPFLWLCIRSITSTSVLQQRAMADLIRRELAERIVVNSERNMDLLLGIITILAWATLNTGPRMKPFLILYSQLAETVIFDLGLLRFPNEEHVSAMGKVWGRKPTDMRERTYEEKRAAVSLWFLTSICNAFTGKVETLHWTPHLEHCLKSLERAEEYIGDGILAAFVRIQQISDEANKLLVQDLLWSGPEAGQTPTYLHKARLLDALHAERQKGTNKFALSYTLTSHLLSAEVQIHVVGLFSNQPMPDERRIDGMYQCLQSIRCWYDAFFERPIHEIPALPFSIYISLSVMQVMLYRLTVLEHPMWDKSVVRGTADVLEILDRTIDMFQQLPNIYPLSDDTDGSNLYVHGARHLKTLRATWAPSLANIFGNINNNMPTPNSQTAAMSMSPSQAHAAQAQAAAMGMAHHPGLMDQGQADFQDMAWIADIFGPWEM